MLVISVSVLPIPDEMQSMLLISVSVFPIPADEMQSMLVISASVLPRPDAMQSRLVMTAPQKKKWLQSWAVASLGAALVDIPPLKTQ